LPLEGLREASIIEDIAYHSVISLYVGEKIMIQMPTWNFPAGAGVFSGVPTTASHGMPDPQASFRFAEPVPIDSQQSFRVDMVFPQGVPGQEQPEPGRLAGLKGPFRIWVVLDGYLTRDVQ
jgi:hypothetical protein